MSSASWGPQDPNAVVRVHEEEYRDKLPVRTSLSFTAYFEFIAQQSAEGIANCDPVAWAFSGSLSEPSSGRRASEPSFGGVLRRMP